MSTTLSCRRLHRGLPSPAGRLANRNTSARPRTKRRGASVGGLPRRLRHPIRTEHLGLRKYRLRGLLLLVGRVPMLLENAFNHDAQLCTHALSFGPVDGDVLPYGLDEVPRDRPERLVPENLHGAI